MFFYNLVNSEHCIYKKEKILKCLYKYIIYVWFTYGNGNINELFYYDLIFFVYKNEQQPKQC